MYVIFRLELELFQAGDVMSSPVVTIQPRELVSVLAKLLVDTSHGGFPVVKKNAADGEEHFYGLITRLVWFSREQCFENLIKKLSLSCRHISLENCNLYMYFMQNLMSKNQ